MFRAGGRVVALPFPLHQSLSGGDVRDENPGEREDPLPCFCFTIEIPGVQAFFKSVSGLKSETEIVHVREGGANGTTFALVGSRKWTPIVLKSGFTADSNLLTWHEEWASGRSMKRQSGVITQLDTALRPMGRWTFVRGWPSRWELGEYDAAKSELVIETLEIAHEGLSYQPLARPRRPAPSTARSPGVRPVATTTPTAKASLRNEDAHAPAPAPMGRAPSHEELVSLNKARFAEIEEVEEPDKAERDARAQTHGGRAPTPVDGEGGARAPTHDEVVSLGKARFPDVE
ncbi:MAG: phage tail protein [Deltaproteobacteria bacterium]|nr:phage tail protein [Deltaproteobacteria bacterium]